MVCLSLCVCVMMVSRGSCIERVHPAELQTPIVHRRIPCGEGVELNTVETLSEGPPLVLMHGEALPHTRTNTHTYECSP